MQLIGILGGTFDPIHKGHICLALEAYKQLELDQVRLIPVNNPPHRNMPMASAEHRQMMIKLATEGHSGLCVDLREFDSNEISYSIDTLRSLRNEFHNDALYLIMGRDTFNKLDTWKDWQQLLDYAHIIVANRPGECESSVTTELQNWITKHRCNDIDILKTKKKGYIYNIEIPMLDISSNHIRSALKQGESTISFLHETTTNYIKENQLYPDTA